MALKLRNLSPEEHDTIEKLAHSRTAAARLVEHARIMLLANQGHRVPAIAHQLQLTAITVRTWLKRFNLLGQIPRMAPRRAERHWRAEICFPTGFWARLRWGSCAAGVLLAMDLLLLPQTLGPLANPIVQVGAAVCGFMAGGCWRLRLHRRS